LNLGTLLRRQRKAKGLTLRSVAEKAGVSEGFLSQVENSVKSPSLESLMNICAALEINPGEVMTQLSNHRPRVVISRSEWDEVDVPHTGFATRRFRAPEERTLIDGAVLFIEPGASIPVRKNIKNGQEILCVLEGSLELVQGEDRVSLGQGDAVHFFAQLQGQRVTNPGRDPAVALWVGTL